MMALLLQVDFLLSRLKVLYERIDDTEDLINIELDHRCTTLLAALFWSLFSIICHYSCLAHIYAVLCVLHDIVKSLTMQDQD